MQSDHKGRHKKSPTKKGETTRFRPSYHTPPKKYPIKYTPNPKDGNPHYSFLFYKTEKINKKDIL